MRGGKELIHKRRWYDFVPAFTGFVAGTLGSFIVIAILRWFSLPSQTIDLLSFTESAFGIGMTVIALIIGLVLVNQVREIDRRFAELEAKHDAKVTEGMENMWQVLKDMATKMSPGQHIILPSMMTQKFDSKQPEGITVVHLPTDHKQK